MVTILVSGSGTGVGKTRVTGALARLAQRNGRTVQIIKPVQTGLAAREPSDAEVAADFAGLPRTHAHTLQRFTAAIAPAAAAKAAGRKLDLKDMIRQIKALPTASVRLIEGAGGIAVPLFPEYGTDWAHVHQFFGADAVLLVVADELGAINQARLIYHYFTSHNEGVKTRVGIFLNALRKPPTEVAASTRAALLECGVPVWGELAADAVEPALYAPLDVFVGK